MSGKIHRYLADDHRRLEGFLDRIFSDSGMVDQAVYAQFRSGLLKHIAWEEKILLPAARRLRGEPLPVAAKLRLDHGALTALLVPPPSPRLIAAIRSILKSHNPLEEDPGGMYDQCEELAGKEADEILRQIEDYPEVKVLPNVDNEFVLEAARRAVARAGYSFEI
ncbi:MAG TPA: hemerythrin domain-containing protein [Methylomirabilota bacterium]|nr:hemerythrin domain-containing protein [Methylomirabilota bacterium]